MADVAIFHSVLGVRPGIIAAADVLRDAGHQPHVIDQYDGRVFDDYEPAMALMREIGWPTLMERALAGCAGLPPGFATLGFSNGAGMAEYVAGSVPGVSGVVMSGGALGPDDLEITWPAGVPGQIHSTLEDPWRDEGIEQARTAIEAAGGRVEVFDYPGKGHLFADPSKADEYQPAEAELMWSRVLTFLDSLQPGVPAG